MSKTNPLGLVSYGDSDDDSDGGSPSKAKRFNNVAKMNYAPYEVSQHSTLPAGIHPAPIPHCPWSACYDENSGFTYYWNQQTNAVTWEAPPEYLLALKLAQQQLNSSGSTEVTAEEWQLYQQALAEKQTSQNKITSKGFITKPIIKVVEKSNTKDRYSKNNKKRPNSDDEEEKIELITSYHNSDSESNDESEKPPPTTPPLPKPPTKLPKHPQKKQKTKSVVEYGPPLPPNQNYTAPIGPELPPQLPVVEKPKVPERIEEKIVEGKEVPEDLPPENETNLQQDVKTGSSCHDEDSQEEQELLKRLKDKAILLEKLGGELPSELQQIIKDETILATVTEAAAEIPKPEIQDSNTDIDDLLEEIEKKELPKVVKSKLKDEISRSNINSENNSPRSGDRTPPLEELKVLFPSANVNGPTTSLFPSAANIDESKPDSRPETPPIVVVEKEKKENVYLMDANEPKENISKKKLRISNSVLPERKKDKVELPSYTTKYSQFIEGFSSERTGLGFTKDEEVEKSPKNTITYGNGLTFTKGETLNEDKKDEDLDDLTELVEAKLKFLNQIQPCVLSPVHEMLIQMQTLVGAFRAGALSGAYWRRWASGAEHALAAHEAAAAPPGWLCVFQRSEGRYCYRREVDGFLQYEYPAVANTDMEICTTPPHPSSDVKEDINPPLPPLPPPPPSPPQWWARGTPPPPGTDPPELSEPPEQSKIESKKEIGDELLSFYNDIAELEKNSEPTAPNSPEVPPPPSPPSISRRSKDKNKERDNREKDNREKNKEKDNRDKIKDRDKEKLKEKDSKDKVPKKKSKVKLSSSLGMKQKSVSSLVAKWQQVAEEIHSD